MPHLTRVLIAAVYLTALAPSCDKKSAEPATTEPAADKPAEAEGKKPAEAEGKKPAEASAKKPAEPESKKLAETEGKKSAPADATKPAGTEAKKPADAKAKKPAEAEAKKPAEAAAKKPTEAKPAEPKATAKPRPSVTNAAVGPWVATLKPKKRTKRSKIDEVIRTSLEELAGGDTKIRFVVPLGKDRFAAGFRGKVKRDEAPWILIAVRVEGDKVIDASRASLVLSSNGGMPVRLRMKELDLDGDGVEDWGFGDVAKVTSDDQDLLAAVFLSKGPSVVAWTWGNYGAEHEKGGENRFDRPLDACFGTFDGHTTLAVVQKRTTEEEDDEDDYPRKVNRYSAFALVQTHGDFQRAPLYGKAVAHSKRLKQVTAAWRELNAAPKADPTATSRATESVAVLVLRRCAGDALVAPAEFANPLPGAKSPGETSGWYVLSGLSPNKERAGTAAKTVTAGGLGKAKAMDLTVALGVRTTVKTVRPTDGLGEKAATKPTTAPAPTFKPAGDPLATSQDPALKAAIPKLDLGENRTPKLKKHKGLIDALNALGKPLNARPVEIVWARGVGKGFGAAWRTVDKKDREYVFASARPTATGFAVHNKVTSKRTGLPGDQYTHDFSFDNDGDTESVVWIRQKREKGYKLGMLLFNSSLWGADILHWGARETRDDGAKVFHDARLFCGQVVGGTPTILLRSQRYVTPEGGKQTTEANLFKAWTQAADGTWSRIEALHGTVVAHSKSYKALNKVLWKVQGLDQEYDDPWDSEDYSDTAHFRTCQGRGAFIAPSFMVAPTGGEKLEKWVIVSGFGHSAEDAKKLAPTIPQPKGKKVVNGTIAVTFPSAKTLWKDAP